MLAASPTGEALVIPCPAILRFLDPLHMANAAPARSAAFLRGLRPWLGLALQPINLPDALRVMAGQGSGRMVVSITPNGPADLGGLRLGDILLAIDGSSLVGSQGLRSVLAPERIGSAVQVRLMRDGALRNCTLTVTAHPDA
jgi:S1-C subfamily serine protease